MPTRDKKNLLTRYQGYIFDLDGTVYRGEHLIEGAVDVFKELRRLGKKVVCVSNKTTGTVAEYHQFLAGKGIQIEKKHIMNATMVTRNFLKRNYAGKTFYAIGEKAFITEIKSAGLVYSENPQKVDILLITLDRFCTFQKLEIASRCLENGAKFFAANIDTTCPVENGEIWDAGSTIAALEKRSRRKLELHFGKPSAFMVAAFLEYMQLPPEKLVIIGDRVETDILMGNQAGIDTIHVLSGVRAPQEEEPVAIATYTIESIKELI
ncbi:MAG: HAD-IIA family hydrolase [Ignavibacteria bacterium]|nr:HAD-IIA family hydrolase [Ignavibacteria bacterium]